MLKLCQPRFVKNNNPENRKNHLNAYYPDVKTPHHYMIMIICICIVLKKIPVYSGGNSVNELREFPTNLSEI